MTHRKSGAWSEAAKLLTRHVTVGEVARASDYSQKALSNGGTSASNYLTAVLVGRDRMTARWEQTIRHLVPEKVADEVCRLAAEAREARRG